MSKIIKMTPEIIENLKKDFEEQLSKKTLLDGKIAYNKTLKDGSEKATVFFTPVAWAKMIMLIQGTDKEIGWHGVAYRSEVEGVNEYKITDILVYPQEVTGATVNTDITEYDRFMNAQDDEVFNNIRMHGHSHVNMGVSPSSVDLSHQERLMAQMEDDMFYIFMIWNKSFKFNAKIYDFKKNTLFETEDVEIKILDAGIGLNEFLANAKKMVKERTYSYQQTKKEDKPAGKDKKGKISRIDETWKKPAAPKNASEEADEDLDYYQYMMGGYC